MSLQAPDAEALAVIGTSKAAAAGLTHDADHTSLDEELPDFPGDEEPGEDTEASLREANTVSPWQDPPASPEPPAPAASTRDGSRSPPQRRSPGAGSNGSPRRAPNTARSNRSRGGAVSPPGTGRKRGHNSSPPPALNASSRVSLISCEDGGDAAPRQPLPNAERAPAQPRVRAPLPMASMSVCYRSNAPGGVFSPLSATTPLPQRQGQAGVVRASGTLVPPSESMGVPPAGPGDAALGSIAASLRPGLDTVVWGNETASQQRGGKASRGTSTTGNLFAGMRRRAAPLGTYSHLVVDASALSSSMATRSSRTEHTAHRNQYSIGEPSTSPTAGGRIAPSDSLIMSGDDYVVGAAKRQLGRDPGASLAQYDRVTHSSTVNGGPSHGTLDASLDSLAIDDPSVALDTAFITSAGPHSSAAQPSGALSENRMLMSTVDPDAVGGGGAKAGPQNGVGGDGGASVVSLSFTDATSLASVPVAAGDDDAAAVKAVYAQRRLPGRGLHPIVRTVGPPYGGRTTEGKAAHSAHRDQGSTTAGGGGGDDEAAETVMTEEERRRQRDEEQLKLLAAASLARMSYWETLSEDSGGDGKGKDDDDADGNGANPTDDDTAPVPLQVDSAAGTGADANPDGGGGGGGGGATAAAARSPMKVSVVTSNTGTIIRRHELDRGHTQGSFMAEMAAPVAELRTQPHLVSTQRGSTVGLTPAAPNGPACLPIKGSQAVAHVVGDDQEAEAVSDAEAALLARHAGSVRVPSSAGTKRSGASRRPVSGGNLSEDPDPQGVAELVAGAIAASVGGPLSRVHGGAFYRPSLPHHKQLLGAAARRAATHRPTRAARQSHLRQRAKAPGHFYEGGGGAGDAGGATAMPPMSPVATAANSFYGAPATTPGSGSSPRRASGQDRPRSPEPRFPVSSSAACGARWKGPQSPARRRLLARAASPHTPVGSMFEHFEHEVELLRGVQTQPPSFTLFRAHTGEGGGASTLPLPPKHALAVPSTVSSGTVMSPRVPRMSDATQPLAAPPPRAPPVPPQPVPRPNKRRGRSGSPTSRKLASSPTSMETVPAELPGRGQVGPRVSTQAAGTSNSFYSPDGLFAEAPEGQSPVSAASFHIDDAPLPQQPALVIATSPTSKHLLGLPVPASPSIGDRQVIMSLRRSHPHGHKTALLGSTRGSEPIVEVRTFAPVGCEDPSLRPTYGSLKGSKRTAADWAGPVVRPHSGAATRRRRARHTQQLTPPSLGVSGKQVTAAATPGGVRHSLSAAGAAGPETEEKLVAAAAHGANDGETPLSPAQGVTVVQHTRRRGRPKQRRVPARSLTVHAADPAGPQTPSQEAASPSPAVTQGFLSRSPGPWSDRGSTAGSTMVLSTTWVPLGSPVRFHTKPRHTVRRSPQPRRRRRYY